MKGEIKIVDFKQDLKKTTTAFLDYYGVKYKKKDTLQMLLIKLYTFFEKYVVPQIGVSNASTGIISGFKSIYPTTIIDVNLDNVLVTCEYNRDINKAYNELQSNYEKLKTAIEKLGGTIE